MSTRTCHASCLCGAVRWEVDGPLSQPEPGRADPMALLSMSHCHCSRCRKAHGAPYATYLCAPEASFRLTHGREHLARWPGAALGWPFCGTCGSVVPDGSAGHGVVSMPAGPFDEDPGLVPRCHIFVASKAPWVTLRDALPRFDAYPDGVGRAAIATRPPLDPEGPGPRGSCLCGGVTYRVTGPVLRSRTCHCGRCRKAGSAAHMSYLVTGADGVTFTRGEDLLVTYKVPDAQFFKVVFCRTCGSNMPRRDPGRGITIVPLGSLDDDPGVRPASHIFVGSRAPWDVITDGLPQFEEMQPS